MAGRALVIAGLAMIPWLVILGATLPASAPVAHWPAACVEMPVCVLCAAVAVRTLPRTVRRTR